MTPVPTPPPSRSPPPSAPRVAIVGARRHRQGLGPFLARFCARAGAEVVGVTTTSRETAVEAAAGLAAAGIDVRPYTDATRMLEVESPEVLVIASPSATHDAYLDLAAERGLHVLCEKPLCWGGNDVVQRARHHVDAFFERGLHLVVNAQWPLTLPTYDSLYPGVLSCSPTSFTMRLSPSSRGADMVPDALPHALSLLAHVVPDPLAQIREPRVVRRSEDDTALDVSFTYEAGGRGIDALVELRQGTSQPRQAAYGFDGHLATRHVDAAKGYRLELSGGGQRRLLPDPTPVLVSSFLSHVVSGASPAVDPAAWPAMAHLELLYTSALDARSPRMPPGSPDIA